MTVSEISEMVLATGEKPLVGEFKQLFSGLVVNLRDQDFETLLAFMTVRSVAEYGFELIKQGQLAQDLYLIRRGLVSVSIDDGNRQEELGMLGAGQWVGDISFIEPGPASATIHVLEAATFLVLTHDDLTRLQKRYPHIAGALLKGLSRQMAERLRNSREILSASDYSEDEEIERQAMSSPSSQWCANVSRWLLGIRSDEIERRAEQAAQVVRTSLAQRFKHLSILDRNRVLENERERILAELHDGVGGQLVAMLAMVENGETSASALKDALRTALDDLRLMIDSLDTVDGDLPVVLGMFRSRIEQRLLAQNIRFDWQVGDLPPMQQLGPHEVLQILRIFQEAVTNCIKHANATVITVVTGLIKREDAQERIFVEVKDNGMGMQGNAGDGHGLNNMRRRAREIGGELYVESHKTGTGIRLFLPC